MTAGWREQAACRGKPVEWFFPGSGQVRDYALGRQVCASCPVQVDCLRDHARAERELRIPIVGLWGGVVQGRSSRMAARQARPVECVVCGATFSDKGTGKFPKYCGANCLNRAAARRRNGAPESDAEFEVWRAARPYHLRGAPVGRRVG